MTNGVASAAQLRLVPSRDHSDAGAQTAGRLVLESRPVTSETQRFQCTPTGQVDKAAIERWRSALAQLDAHVVRVPSNNGSDQPRLYPRLGILRDMRELLVCPGAPSARPTPPRWPPPGRAVRLGRGGLEGRSRARCALPARSRPIFSRTRPPHARRTNPFRPVLTPTGSAGPTTTFPVLARAAHMSCMQKRANLMFHPHRYPAPSLAGTALLSVQGSAGDGGRRRASAA